jgi:hypothetical protein
MTKPKSIEDILKIPASKELAEAMAKQILHRQKKCLTWAEMAQPSPIAKYQQEHPATEEPKPLPPDLSTHQLHKPGTINRKKRK